jgi:hypothetical protein
MRIGPVDGQMAVTERMYVEDPQEKHGRSSPWVSPFSPRQEAHRRSPALEALNAM